MLFNAHSWFYRHTTISSYRAELPSYFYKEGYICAAYSECGWRRAMVLVTAPLDAQCVNIEYVDHALSVTLAPNHLRFLPLSFARTPPLVFRGKMSHVRPLANGWPKNGITAFQRMTFNRVLYAHVGELDTAQGIFSMRLSYDETFVPTINDLIESRIKLEPCCYAPELQPFGMVEPLIMPLHDYDDDDDDDDFAFVP